MTIDEFREQIAETYHNYFPNSLIATELMEIPADVLLDSVTKVDGFKSNKEAYPALVGINFDSGIGQIAATDSYTMAFRNMLLRIAETLPSTVV